MVSFIGNDAHTTKAQFLSPISVSDYCTKIIGKEKTKKLLISYELAVINDIIIETEL